MVDTISAAELDGRDLPDWRFILGRIEARFRAPSFAAAADFVAQVASAADRLDHHPAVDLRHPGHVHLALMTEDVNGVTEADVGMASTISQLAAGAGLVSEPRGVVGLEVAIDAMDIDAVRPFWKAILGYDDEPPSRPGGQVVALVDPLRIAPAFWFQQMDEPRPQRNRIHLDVTIPQDEAEARIAAALAAGGHLVEDRYARAFWVLADPEGNEACVCTWQDRD